MESVYIDLHIHTSENPDNLNSSYDIDLLINKIKKFSNNSEYLISLTDHNTINKVVYLKAKTKINNLLLGAELHVRNYQEANPYHCHIYFNIKNISEEIIDDINEKLNKLYPKKVVNKKNDNIPSLEMIIKTFDSYDFLLLPHGGQSHSTFDTSIPEGVKFDNSIERNIYYNQFDGFTARSNQGLERTIDYFKRLGINEFVNLITCTDNYNPHKYPQAKSSDAATFVPTWMFALPTFEGLRISLSESSRLSYCTKKPSLWTEYIVKAYLKEDNINIDANLTPGLNVVIGGSSSGKTLFVDSVYNRINNDFSNSVYEAKFNVNKIIVDNPSGIKPYYISQNYIMKIIDNNDSDNTIDDIDIIKNVFPGDEIIKKMVTQGLLKLKSDLNILIESVKKIEFNQEQLKRIPVLSRLISTENVQSNIFKTLIPSESEKQLFNYDKSTFSNHINLLKELGAFLTNYPFIKHDSRLIKGLVKELEQAHSISIFEKRIRDIITAEKEKFDQYLKTENLELQSKKQDFEKLLELIRSYSKELILFYKTLKEISEYSIECESQEVESMGHKLFIENKFILNKLIFLEIINYFLKKEYTIDYFDEITPECLFKSKYKKRSPKVRDYEDFKNKVYTKFEEMNKRTYRIITDKGKLFDELSAGWKTSVILDIVLGYEGDMAPLIIDQPEDNLATDYINRGLIEAIKKIKSKKQVILVSHNATIPMLGDAQNIILCENDCNVLKIRSNKLEEKHNDKSIVDYIAEITDGGKSSIKKRVKKYNLKKFRE